MPVRWFLSLTLLFLGVSFGCASAQPMGDMDLTSTRSSADSFFFIQMSDPQIGMFDGKGGRVATDFRKEINNFRMAIAEANRLQPAFVVLTGDLIQLPGNRRQIELFNTLLKEFDPKLPVYLVPGNHDAGNKPTEASVAAYRRDFAKDQYTFQVGKTHFIVLNSCLLHRPAQVQTLAHAQMARLQRDLEAATQAGADHIVVFMHHPLFLKEPREADGYFVIPKVRRQPILDLLKAHKASAVFAGHWHGNSHGRDGKLQMITTGPIGKPLHEAPSGFRIVRVGPGPITHRYYGLGAIPWRVDF